MIDSLQFAVTWIIDRVSNLLLVRDFADRLYWGYLLLFIIIAFVLYLIRKPENTKLKDYIFPRSILMHQSSKVDLCIYLLNGILNGVINIATLLFSVALIAKSLNYVLTSVLGLQPIEVEPTIVSTVIVSMLFVFLFDFGLFLAHYLHHRIPFLWNFHKVHHSAEVLTPVTAYRFHPVDTMCTGAILAVVVGPFVGIYQFLFTGTLLDVNPAAYGFALILFLLTANFRHSHIPIHFSNALSQFLVSPAMHNVHHSAKVVHFDKNMGFMFSIWDKLAKTHYVPGTQEADDLKFGIGKNEEKKYRSVLACYWRPLKETFRLFKQTKNTTSDSKNTANVRHK